jgi:6-phosphogluconolactonase
VGLCSRRPPNHMQIQVYADDEAAARAAAESIAVKARASVKARGSFTLAVSGGQTPVKMFRALASEFVPWESLHLVQVDERIAPSGSPDRNFTHLREALLEQVPLPPDHVHPMLVESPDLEAAARDYARTLVQVAGTTPVLDLAHLGIGPDGHTASLVPHDPVLDVHDRDVALTGIYSGHRRMTLTYPMLNRSRNVIWLVTGSEKADMLRRLRKGDPSIPAGRIRAENTAVFADRAAARALDPGLVTQYF